MKNFLQLVLLSLLIVSCQRNDTKTKEFLKRFDEIRLLSYNTYRDTYANYTSDKDIKIKNDTITIPNIRVVDNIVLNSDCSERILNILFSERKSRSLADCYYPRHILLFYKAHKLIGFYEFSVSCGGSCESKNLNIETIYIEQGKELIDLFKEIRLKNNGEESDTYKYF